jgi:hypothetical protein
MDCWTDAFQIPVEMYSTWMKKRKGRQKARFYKKLNRLAKRSVNLE